MKYFEANHSYMLPSYLSFTLFSEDPLLDEVDSILRCVELFPKWASCGRNGLRAQHIY